MRPVAIAALLFTLALAAPASAQLVNITDKFVATGDTGVTKCEVETHINDRMFSDRFEWTVGTECTVAIEQLSEGWWERWDGSLEGSPTCSGVLVSCHWTGSDQGSLQSSQLLHHVELRAPRGQGWITDHESCSGTGTDNLECWITTG